MSGISTSDLKLTQISSNGDVKLDYRFFVSADCLDDPKAFLPSSSQLCCGPFSTSNMEAYRTYVFDDQKSVFEYTGKLGQRDTSYESERIRMGYLDVTTCIIVWLNMDLVINLLFYYIKLLNAILQVAH